MNNIFEMRSKKNLYDKIKSYNYVNQIADLNVIWRGKWRTGLLLKK